MKRLLTLAILLALSSCSSPPKPPTVDGSQRRPANAQAEVDLHDCRSELQNERILASERNRENTSLRARLASFLTGRTAATAVREQRNAVYTVLFPFGATTLELPKPELDALATMAQAAPLIVLSGRTDGIVDGTSESRVARARAEFMRDVLVRAGVPVARIRTTWQAIGDHAADNGSPTGRALNRRVEIEFYRVAPRVGRHDSAAAA